MASTNAGLFMYLLLFLIILNVAITLSGSFFTASTAYNVEDLDNPDSPYDIGFWNILTGLLFWNFYATWWLNVILWVVRIGVVYLLIDLLWIG